MEDPYVHIEGQDYYAEKDISRDNGILIKESKPVFLATLSEYVELGRDLCEVEFDNVPEPEPLPYVLENVMGQEDIYRLGDDGQRDLNTQTARIVATSVRPTTMVIEYGAVFADPVTGIETWDLTESHEETTPTGYHDAIIAPVSPDTLYAFRVIVTEVDTGEVKTSEVHFFRTEDFIVLELDLLVYVSSEKIAVDDLDLVVNQMTAVHAFPDPPYAHEVLVYEPELVLPTVDHTIDRDLTSTDLSITVSWETL